MDAAAVSGVYDRRPMCPRVASAAVRLGPQRGRFGTGRGPGHRRPWARWAAPRGPSI